MLSLHDGTVFLVECDEGVTGLVLIGRGEMRFSPTPAAERGQLRIFSGSDTLTSPFEEAFIRLSPSDYEKRVTTASLTPSASAGAADARAQEIFARESTKSFNVDLQDLSPDDVVPAAADRRLPRRGRHAPVRHADVHALVGAGRGRHAVPAEGSAHDRAVSLGRQAGRARALLQRRCAARLRRARLQHRRGGRSRAADDSGARPAGDPRARDVAVARVTPAERSARR